MKVKIILFISLIVISCPLKAQFFFKGYIKDSMGRKPLEHATVLLKGTNKSAIADSNGLVILNNIPGGIQILVFNYVGLKEKQESFTFPLISEEFVQILLEESGEEMGEVVITSTRNSRTIRNLPTRVEFISGEELAEKGNMKPGDIRMMLNESTGIQTQQTSATSNNSTIRIQGLDGKYTQIIRDGFPLYSGFSEGLGLLQVAPLDLKQVEVIKGASSTLYGGGAIAGLVNLVSKLPGDKRELNFLLNGTSALGFDASSFYSENFKKFGTTLFASFNHGTPYGPSPAVFTAIPKFDRFTFNPKAFLYLNDRTTLSFGLNTMVENRLGGDIQYTKGKGDSLHSYFEQNKTSRLSSQLAFNHTINSESYFSFKNSVSYYNRSIQIPGYEFSGVQLTSFTEASFSYRVNKMQWIAGVSYLTDKFTQGIVQDSLPVNYNQNTVGAFIQNTWDASDKVIFETGIRGDYQNDYGFFLLPRISTLFIITKKLSFRVGGGLGYKSPNVFTGDAEKIQFRNVLPINTKISFAEKSYGANVDINYHTQLFNDQISFSINQLFFYTRINNPSILTPIANGMYEYLQPAGFIDTKGIETNVRLAFHSFKLFIGYTFADVKQHYAVTSEYPLVSRSRLNNVLIYEMENNLKVGLEGYYYSPQKLNDGTVGRDYWLCGLMAEKIWNRYSLFVNFENILNVCQTEFGPIYTGNITSPVFKDIYAPLDGLVINGGIKVRL